MKRHESREGALQNAAISRVCVLRALEVLQLFSKIVVLCALKLLQFPGFLCSVHLKVLLSKIVVLCALKTAAISRIFLQLPGSVHLKTQQVSGLLVLCELKNMLQGFFCNCQALCT